MIKIKVILPNYLKSKYLSNIIELKYSNLVSICQLIKDLKIDSANTWVVKVEDLIVKKDYIVRNSCDIKFFPIVGGG
jgi:sulfur carrier protein ThiS